MPGPNPIAPAHRAPARAQGKPAPPPVHQPTRGEPVRSKVFSPQRVPAVSPVYHPGRPQPVQPKTNPQLRRPAGAPPVYRPHPRALLQMKSKSPAPPVYRIGAIQRCPKCGDPLCNKGEKCKLGDDLGGLFAPGIKADAVKYYNQQQGHQGNPTQWEHPVAGAALRASGNAAFYSRSPVIQMPTVVHRGAIEGMGKGVTSTGSSHTSQGWAQVVSTAITTQGNSAGVKKGLVDDINAYASRKQLDEGHKSTFVQVIRGYVEQGFITETEGNVLAAEILKHIDDMLKFQRFF
jgi:hypothetical protein